MARIRAALALFAALIAPAVAAASDWAGKAPQQPLPLIGTNYTHFSDNNCRVNGARSLVDTGIIADWQKPGVASKVRDQLAAMRANGIQTLRLILWHEHDPKNAHWGVISSAGGHLSAPDRSSLVAYLQAVKDAGFTRLTLSFAPSGENDPRSRAYNPKNLEENWSVLLHVRYLLKQFGPAQTNVDLFNEAVPRPADSSAVKRVSAYIAEIYRRYAKAFGTKDVSISVITKQAATDVSNRLRILLAALRSSGAALPRWFDVHPAYGGAQALDNLITIDRTLDQNGLDQSLVISETAYNDPSVAAAIAQFLKSSRRAVLEVIEWPQTANKPCRGISVAPPYSADAYIKALRPNGRSKRNAAESLAAAR